MPIHDWTRVIPGVWHDFHLKWIGRLADSLNRGVLPADMYALAEQHAGRFGPDVLTLHSVDPTDETSAGVSSGRRGAPAPAALKRYTSEAARYGAAGRTIAIRHASGDRVVAMIELVSPGNKANGREFRRFVDKIVETTTNGVHVLVVDLFPPTTRDPHGIHAAIWAEIDEEIDDFEPGRPLTLASYLADGDAVTAYVEPTAVGRPLFDMPLYLSPDDYVTVPLEATYLTSLSHFWAA